MANRIEVPTSGPSRDIAGLSIAVVAGLGLSLAALFLCTMPLAGHLAGSRDFVSYWATGRQLVEHANPYDRNAISLLEHSVGLDPRAVLIMRNPPWALPLAYPLGFIGVRLGAFLWSLTLIACLAASVGMVRRAHGAPASLAHWLGMAFTPALLCLTMGQTSLFSLLGLVLFQCHVTDQPFWAGAALWLCLLKPHLFLPFAAALCMWIIYFRVWRVVAGTITALAISCSAAWLIDPHAWPDYMALMRSPAVENDFIPCLPVLIRFWLRPQAIWIQYLPAVACSVWATVYFWHRRSAWSWARHGGTLMLVSLLAAPYCWLYDQCLAIPALLHGAYSVRPQHFVTVLAGLILIADIQLGFVKVISPLWIWTAPAWLLWFLFANSSSGKHGKEMLEKQQEH